ncbi:IS66 family transposase [Ketobacter sp. GenoA1]|uniref:IS66 family transposase n=1 Tax=Ketobacter sp. GenoA1 TaxID=2072747 RepID=UPI000F279172|nr:MAG: hypothetical protein D9N13_20660 [Ketobacter sp. GenoA1]
MPPQPIPKSQASPGFLAYIVTSKYADALPLYRQCHILKRSGIDYARNTLCHQVVKAGELLQPVINLMHEQLLEYPVLQMDKPRYKCSKNRAVQRKIKVICGYYRRTSLLVVREVRHCLF